jgi:hypothetical protein
MNEIELTTKFAAASSFLETESAELLCQALSPVAPCGASEHRISP